MVSTVQNAPLSQTRSGALVPVLLVLAVALALRLFGVTTHSLWFDEGYTLALTRVGSFAEFMEALLAAGPGQRTQPLYFLLLYGWEQAFGTTDFATRSLSVLMGFAATVVLTVTARRAFDSRYAFWVALVAGTSSFAIYYSHEARPYALLLLTTALVLWAYAEAVMAPRLRLYHGIALALAGAVMLLTSVIAAFFLAAVALADLLIWRRFGRWILTWLLPVLVGSAVMVGYGLIWPSTATVSGAPNPLLNLFYVPFGLIVGQTFGPSLDTLRGPDVVQVVLQMWPRFVVLALVCLAILWQLRRLVFGSAALRMSDDQLRLVQALAVMLVLSYIIGAALMFGLDFNWLPRRATYIYALLALLLPLAAMGPGSRVLATLPVLALVVLNLASLWIYNFDPAHRRDAYRTVADYVVRNDEPGTVSALAWGQIGLLRHYGDDLTVNIMDPLRTAAFEPALLDDLAGEHDVVRLLINREWNFNNSFAKDNDRTLSDAMNEEYVLIGEESFAAFKIYTYQKISSD